MQVIFNRQTHITKRLQAKKETCPAACLFFQPHLVAVMASIPPAFSAPVIVIAPPAIIVVASPAVVAVHAPPAVITVVVVVASTVVVSVVVVTSPILVNIAVVVTITVAVMVWGLGDGQGRAACYQSGCYRKYP